MGALEMIFDQGKAQGKAEALLAQLRRRGFAVDRATEQRVLGTTDIALIDEWLDRVLDAKRIEDVLGAGREA